jgi:Fur family transcriptional regulator, ferric uptake regulator
MITSTQTNHPLHTGGESLDPQARVEAACSSLRSAGLRITQPRIAILGVLIARGHPVSIEQIHAELSNRSCDLVTVYRCLAAFEEIGLVRRSFLHNGTSLYQLSDRKESTYHIVSKDGSEISAVDEAASDRIAQVVKQVEEELRAVGYTEVSHLLQFFAKSSAENSEKNDRSRLGQASIPASA